MKPVSLTQKMFQVYLGIDELNEAVQKSRHPKRFSIRKSFNETDTILFNISVDNGAFIIVSVVVWIKKIDAGHYKD